MKAKKQTYHSIEEPKTEVVQAEGRQRRRVSEAGFGQASLVGGDSGKGGAI